MTKLEALLQFSNYRRRDTWAVYGGYSLPSTQTEFMKDDIFLLQAPGTIWDNAIFYVKNELHLTATFTWADYTFNDQTKGTIWNSSGVIDPNFYCILTAAQITAIAEPVDTSFIAFASIDPIDIESDTLDTILLEVGIPFITFEELEFTREQILNLMIKPAMEEYYKWYPIRIVEQFPVASANIRIPIPPYVKTVERAYLNPGYPITGIHKNPITRYFDEVVLAATSRGTFANPSVNYRNRQPFADLQGYSTFLLEKAVRQGAINHGARKRIRVELQNGFIVGYSNIQGILEVEWNTISYKWTDIPYNRQSEVRDYATAKVLRALASLRMQANAELPGIINYQAFMDRANALEEKVIELWQNSTKVVVMR